MSAKQKTVTVAPAKGRPMLSWVGKRPLSRVTVFPAQCVELHTAFHLLGIDMEREESPVPRSAALKRLRPSWNAECWEGQPAITGPVPEWGGLLFHGDNKDVLAYLLAEGYRGKVNLVYIDPPFDSGADYVRKVTLRGPKGTARLDGEGYTLGEQLQYTDIWVNDNYLQFMYERVLLLKELLDEESGFIALQCDWRKSHHLRCVLEEVFGSNNFRGEILIRAGTKNVQSQFDEVSSLTTGNNSILLFSKSADAKFPKLTAILQEGEPGKWDTFWRGTDRHTLRYELLGETPPNGQWRWTKERALKAVEAYKRYLDRFQRKMTLDQYYVLTVEKEKTEIDFVRKDESGTVQYYVAPRDYRLLSNVWFDLAYRGTATEYPTEKNEEPIERLLTWLTKPGALVLDSFVGSGTTAAVAQKLGRRWIGCDINKGAIQTAAKRLRAVIGEQIDQAFARANGKKQQKLFKKDEEHAEAPVRPAQFGFTVWRVNDYDLQVQHNEAVRIACEHIGVERTRQDRYFDGLRSGALVKITPFNHPLTPLDLEELKDELAKRPEEDRHVTVVCLGMELGAREWLEEWNRHRKGQAAVNRIDAIELRTDPRYGKFLIHQPSTARLKVQRKKDRIVVTVTDFISPTIIERLSQQGGVLEPKIEDWRSMVDSIMIDTAYNGEVFNVVCAEVPERKTDLVTGEYNLRAPKDETTVAVKITDMLGEEVIETRKV